MYISAFELEIPMEIYYHRCFKNISLTTNHYMLLIR